MVIATHVKRQLDALWAAPMNRVSRARAILRVAFRVEKRALRLARLSDEFSQRGRFERSNLAARSAAELLRLLATLRTHAKEALTRNVGKMSFGYAPRQSAYPSWQVHDRDMPWRPTANTESESNHSDLIEHCAVSERIESIETQTTS